MIKPRLEEWAEVGSYDPPGVGDEPLPDGDPDSFTPELFVERGEAELERLGWERCFILADGWGIPTGVRIASRRPERVEGSLSATRGSRTGPRAIGPPSTAS